MRDRAGLEPLDPYRHQGVQVETERSFDGSHVFLEPSVTVFLTGTECPFQCTFCDLWRYTLDGPTPAGALPAQLASAMDEVSEADRSGLLKLYNASNWFDERAVPAVDDAAVASLSRGFRRVVVESHARLVGERCRGFSAALDGRLQVALGVETVHPEAIARSRKGLGLDDLTGAAGKLRAWGVEIRTFVLVGAPHVPVSEALQWIVRSCEFSLNLGAVAVSLIPLRPIREDQDAPSLELVEEAWSRCRTLSPAVGLDTWNLERFVVPDDPSTVSRVEGLRCAQLDFECARGEA